MEIYINSKRLPDGTLVKKIEYRPDFAVIKNTNTIRCYSKDILKSISNFIIKFIQRCEETVTTNSVTSNLNHEFMNELNAALPNIKIDYTHSNRRPGQKTTAKIDFDNGCINLYHIGENELSVIVAINEDSKQNIYATINKLLR